MDVDGLRGREVGFHAVDVFLKVCFSHELVLDVCDETGHEGEKKEKRHRTVGSGIIVHRVGDRLCCLTCGSLRALAWVMQRRLRWTKTTDQFLPMWDKMLAVCS